MSIYTYLVIKNNLFDDQYENHHIHSKTSILRCSNFCSFTLLILDFL